MAYKWLLMAFKSKTLKKVKQLTGQIPNSMEKKKNQTFLICHWKCMRFGADFKIVKYLPVREYMCKHGKGEYKYPSRSDSLTVKCMFNLLCQ